MGRGTKDPKEVLRRGDSLGAILQWPNLPQGRDRGLLDGQAVTFGAVVHGIFTGLAKETSD